jgi:hypothetical protein
MCRAPGATCDDLIPSPAKSSFAKCCPTGCPEEDVGLKTWCPKSGRRARKGMRTCLCSAEARLRLVPPKGFKSIRRKRGVARGVLNVSMTQVSLKRTGIVAVIRQLVAAGVAQHVSVNFNAKIGRNGRPFRPCGKSRERSAGRRAPIRTRMASRCSHADGAATPVAHGPSRLDSTNAQDCRFEIDLLPT